MKNNESKDSFSSFRLLIAVGWLLMALQFVGIINIGWVLLFHYWLLLIGIYVGLLLFVSIVTGIITAINNHKG